MCSRRERMLKKIWSNKPLIGLIIFAVIVSVLNPRFLTHANILNVLRQTSINSIIAIGMTLVILTGGIDLSVGSILAFCGAVMASLLNAGHNPILAFIVTLALGLVFGFFNGFLVSKMKLQAFIVTLVTMTFLRGATLVFTEGKPITVDDGGLLFENIGGGYLFDIPIPIYIMIALFVAGHYLLMHTKFGRYTYAIGGNEEATKLSGINVDKVKMWVYGLCGMLSALAGVILTSRLYSAQPTAGSGYELDAIAAVVLGGTSLAGGVGRVTGTALGALIIGVLGNALNLLNVSSYYQMMIKAIVILIAVLIDRKSNK
ncbi:MAG: ribose ABC transporter permease [Fusobacterium mortiferum]|nr:ribose ABC transporter permease [Fusobacterium mortiferum]